MLFSIRVLLIYTLWNEFLLYCPSALLIQSFLGRSPLSTSLNAAVPTRSVHPVSHAVLDDALNFLNSYDKGMLSYVLSSSKRRENNHSSTAIISSGGAASRSLAHITTHFPEKSAARQELREHVQDILSFRLLKSITLGFCAPDVQAGLNALKGYVGYNSLPRGLLHGMDVDGVPVDIKGAVYIRYCSGRGMWQPGDAKVDKYDGEYEGVYVNVDFGKGDNRQWGVMPLDLFSV